jgi:predicted O-methyltransferase YrrM
MVMNIVEYLNRYHKDVDGWCSVDKANKLVNIITGSMPDLCVEIGVFGGSSLLPQAIALKQNGKGLIVGIDPWTHEAALEEMVNDANKSWWGTVNLQKIYQKLAAMINQLKLNDYVDLIKDKADNVVDNFKDETIDILHIDGNHCEKMAYADSKNYLPKVKKGGFIFYDDIYWSEESGIISTKKGLDFLLKSCEKIDQIGDCVILKKIS